MTPKLKDNNILVGKPLTPNYAVATRYDRALADMINKMAREYEREIKALFNSDEGEAFFAQDASLASKARILTNKLQRKFDALFADTAKTLSEQVVAGSNRASAVSLRDSLTPITNGLSLSIDILNNELKEVLTASVAENVGLIKSIASQYLSGVQGAVMRSIAGTGGLQDLVPFLHKHRNITLKRARMIALDQTRKIYANINASRAQALGIEEFKWMHVTGSRHPRKKHIELSGKIFRFDSPPVADEKTGGRFLPGEQINCRCLVIPVIKFD